MHLLVLEILLLTLVGSVLRMEGGHTKLRWDLKEEQLDINILCSRLSPAGSVTERPL